MRQLDRMQMGVALAALVLCLTSTVGTVAHPSTPAPAVQDSAQTLGAVSGVDVMRDQVVTVWRRDAIDQRQIAVLVRGTDGRYEAVAQEVMHAKQLHAPGRDTAYTLIFYAPDGRPDLRFGWSTDGLIHDPRTDAWFATSPVFSAMIQRLEKEGMT